MRFSVRSSREICRGRVIRWIDTLVRLPDGRETTFHVIEHPGAVAVVPRFDNGDVLLIRQFRVPARRELFEIPAGTLEPRERPGATARRELIEETGYRARSFVKIAEFYTAPGFCTELMHLYEARGLSPAYAPADEDEVIEPVRVSRGEAMRMIERGRIRDAKSIVGLLMTHGRK